MSQKRSWMTPGIPLKLLDGNVRGGLKDPLWWRLLKQVRACRTWLPWRRNGECIADNAGSGPSADVVAMSQGEDVLFLDNDCRRKRR